MLLTLFHYASKQYSKMRTMQTSWFYRVDRMCKHVQITVLGVDEGKSSLSIMYLGS